MNRVIRRSASIAVFGLLAMLSSSLLAMPINGSFTLVDDADPTIVFASGNFVTDAFVMGDTDVAVTTFNVNDKTNLLPPNFADLFGDFTLADFSAGVTALLNPNGFVVGFEGLGVNALGSEIDLVGPNGGSLPPFSPFPTFTIDTATGATISASVSGLQKIPEPGSIALMGIGLLGFGMAAWRRRSI